MIIKNDNILHLIVRFSIQTALGAPLRLGTQPCYQTPPVYF